MPVNSASLNNLKPFAAGHDPRRNTAGRPPAGLSFLEHINELSRERKNGRPYFTLDQLQKLAEAPATEPVSIMRRAAARALAETALPGRRGREALMALMNRLVGYPRTTSEVREIATCRVVVVPVSEWASVRSEFTRRLDEQHAQAPPAGLLPASARNGAGEP